MPTKNEKYSCYTVSYLFYALFSEEPVAAPIFCGLDSPISSGVLGDVRGETAQDQDRHGFPTNSRVQQEVTYLYISKKSLKQVQRSIFIRKPVHLWYQFENP